MPDLKSWILTDTAAGVWRDSFACSSSDFAQKFSAPWSIRKRTLRGGKQEGVDLIEVDNGALAFSILPTRGMGLWRGQYHRLGAPLGDVLPLGWRSPVRGPVHPKLVNLMDRGGLGWLDGFDEWIVRCGLHSNGPPGHDPASGQFLPLHGRIANQPAHYVEVQVELGELDPPHQLRIIGQVDEATLFFANLQLTTTISSTPGSNRLVIRDEIQNRASKPAELQVLYHCQFGPPFLGEGSRVRAPIREVLPRNARAAEGIDRYDIYTGPVCGYVEQVYFYHLLTDQQDRTLALLHDDRREKGVALRFNKTELPHFIVWKNTAAEADGYVTGLEPATNLPNFKSFEREHGRVIPLPPGGTYSCSLAIEVHDTPAGVTRVLQEIDALQGQIKPVVHSQPVAEYCQP